MEKSGLSNECYFDCAELAASTNDTIGVTHAPVFNFNQSGLGLAEFISLVCDFNAASTASVTIQNEYEIKTKYEGGQDEQQTQTTHLTTLVIDSTDRIGATGAGLCEIKDAGCVFGGT